MNEPTILRWTMAGAAAVIMLSSAAAIAQIRPYAPGTDCSKLLSQTQQTDCQVQQEYSTMGPGSVAPAQPSGNGTNQNGTLNPNGSSGQINGGTLGNGAGNGGVSQPGQSGN